MGAIALYLVVFRVHMYILFITNMKIFVPINSYIAPLNHVNPEPGMVSYFENVVWYI